ncbi:MAG: ATP-binding cassette domain-containing protein [Desulfurispora sp.]|uniref:ATP-binding cassette domain-containing protein n=1 Tax=Desulfurispora sp. TaxID=3014275 RepID=UPI00404B951D
MPVIELINVSHTYWPGTPLARPALRDVNLSIAEGECWAVVGTAGSGKSTLVQHVAGFLLPDHGRVLVYGGDTADKKVRRELWRRVGLVFQYPERQFFEESVLAEVAYGALNLGLDRREAERRARLALQAVGLDDRRYAGLSPFRLSGGEKRRVAIAATLVIQPPVLVLDEPTAGLDPAGRQLVLQLLRDLKQSGRTVILVTHQMELAAAVADQLAVLSAGRLLAAGKAPELFFDRQLWDRAGLEPPLAVEIQRRLGMVGVELAFAPVLGCDELADGLLQMWGRR